MSPLRITIAALGAAVALVAAGCGGGGQSVPDNAVAVVDGTVISKAELDKLVTQTKNNYEATKQKFPKAGTTEYQTLQTQWVQYLVQNAELQKAAADRGITVTAKEVDKSEKQLIDAQFGGKRSEYLKALKAQGLTAADYRPILERQALTAKLFDAVTKDVTVSDKDILDYYAQNQAQYPESRDVRHILLEVTNPPGCQPGQDAKCKVDFAKSKAEADKIYAQLKAGASFAALAKQYSKDPGSKNSGGKLTIQRGQTVPQFEKAAFALKVGQISKPVKTVYGYHVIEALSPVKGNFDSYKETVRQTLLQQRKNDAMKAWVEKLTNDYKGKVSYATGFEPPTLPEVPTTATE
jgi:parvulin-like peptidyl-prolyl isomerase